MVDAYLQWSVPARYVKGSLVELRERRQIFLLHRTPADKARHDVLRSSTVRFRPTSPNLAADLSEFTAHYTTSEDFLSADKKSAIVWRPLEH